MTAIAKAEDKYMPNYGPTIQGVPVVKLAEQRDDLLMALKSLRALISDCGVQDADDAWYAAVLHEMLREREDGSTPLSDFIDKMSEEAIDQGSLGLHENFDHRIKHGEKSPLETW